MAKRTAGVPDAARIASALNRRDFLRCASATLALLVSPVGRAAGASVLAVRVWPAEEYTRVTLEYQNAVNFNQFIVKNPERLVLDLEGMELNSVLQSLPGKIAESDPYIKLIRAGRFKPGLVRLVFDLKTEVNPQVFSLKPVGDYANRLVIDLYPAVPHDPLLALLRQAEQQEKAAEAQIKPDPAEDEEARNSPGAAGEGVVPVKEGRRPGKQKGRAGSRDEPVVTRMVTIVLDPGHGGEDPGAIGARGSQEKSVTLQVARRLKKRIDGEPNMRSVLTRDADFFIPLHHRVAKARRVRADLFVSIHADAFVKPTARGSSVFVLSERGATSTAARWLAQKENASDLIGGANLDVKDPHLARTLLDLSQTATINDSLKLGKAVLTELGEVNTLHKAAVEQAGFAVLKAPDIPSILVETAFISNPEEERRLNDERHQEELASAILRGIKRYFAKNPPLAKSKIARLD
ncbi:MAG: N-acetylmuramoyl-L-alanine amidase [Rhodocyclaceae bacterium]